MTRHAQQLVYRYEGTDRPDHEYDELDRNLAFRDDPTLGIAYAISKWAISALGPVFWICLGYLFLVAEFGH